MVTHGPWRLLLSVGRSVVSNFGVSKFVFCCGPHALIGPFLTLHDEQKIHDQGKGLMPKPREICARTGTYVRNKASRIETKEIVLSSPAEKKTLSACHALQSAWIAPRPGPMCPAGLRVPENLMWAEKRFARREKLSKLRKFDQHTYIYG